jgi:hypothetical protein
MLALEQDTLPRVPEFDPWRYAATPALRAVVEELTRYALNVETHLRLRTRQRRPADMAVFRSTIEALVCNVLYWTRLGHSSFRVTRSKRELSRASRYTSPLLTKQLPDILDLLIRPEAEFIEQKLGARNPFGHDTQTEVAPTARLLTRLAAVGADDTDRREGEELVLLKGTKNRHAASELVEYADDQLTHQYRAEVRRINAALRETNIEYQGDAPGIDERDTHLRRVFNNGSFGEGGRLFGGFWQRLSKQDRLANIRIECERVVGLDFKAMMVHLAYAYANAEAPSGDPYALPVALPRATVKQLFGACLAVEKPLGNWPKGIDSSGVKLADAVRAITEAHPSLAPLLYQGRGLTLMFTESEVLIDALLRLLDKGVVALPVHDCLVVAESQVDVARQAMVDAFAHNCRGRLPQIAEERATSST